MSQFTFSAEFFPPKTEEAEKALLQTARELAALSPKYLTVTYGAGGSTQDKTVDTAVKIQDLTGIPMATHLTCVGAQKEEIKRHLDSLWAKDLKHIIALRGDPPKGGDYPPIDDPSYYHYGSELTAAIKAHNPGFEISVGAYPEKHPQAETLEQDMLHLKCKMEQGADRAVTQFFFTQGCYRNFADKYRAMDIPGELVPGIVAINNFENIRRFARICEAKMPEDLIALFEAAGDDKARHDALALDFMIRQIKELVSDGAQHIHIYSMNQSNPTLAALKTFLG